MLFSPLERWRSVFRSTVIRSKFDLLTDTSNLPFAPFRRPWSKSQSQPDRFRFLLLAFVAAMPLSLLLPWFWHRGTSPGFQAEAGLANALPLLEDQLARLELEGKARTIAIPQGWQAIQTSVGLTAYVAPEAEVPVLLPSRNFSAFRGGGSLVSSTSGSTFGRGADEAFDGTRKPYVTDVSFSDLKQVAPGRYQWSGVWEGEGYDRVFDQQTRLVSPREGGAEIQLNVSWDATITDPQQPNFVVTVESRQDQTTQLTNFSAFLTDTESGKILDRIDFGQLPPLYRVALRRDGLDAEIQTLPPLGKVTFADHIRPDQIESYLPLQLAAENQFFEQRLKQFAELENQGWVIKEVPPPSFMEQG